MNKQEILDAIPHRDPFLFVDEIVHWNDNEILCKKTFLEEEFFYKGHYPHFAITPGVILCEAAMQAGAIFLSKMIAGKHGENGGIPVVGRMNDVKFRQMVRPGDEVLLHVTLKEKMNDVYFMKAKVTMDGKIAVTFDFACKRAQEKI